MKFLIAGLGSIGRRHLRNLAALGQEDILLYRTHHSTLPEDELAAYPVETDLAAALAHQPDAVIVSNPTSLHLAAAIPAAQAGCHLLLEKPVSHNTERLDELRRAVDENDVRVLVGFQFRHHPGLQKIKELLDAKTIGRPLSFRAHWGEYLPGWHPWEDYRTSYAAREDLGGGVVRTLSHPLDYLGWLFGEVGSLWAFAGQLSDLELDVEDTAEIGLRYKNGVTGSLQLNYNQRPPRHQLEIVCTQGTIRWDHGGKALEVYFAQEESWRQFPLPEEFERDDLFRAQMTHFLEVVAGKTEPVCSLADGLDALELAAAVLESAKNGVMIQLND